MGDSYGCVEQYRRATTLYLLPILAHAYDVIIDHFIGAPGHDRDVVDSLNATGKRFISISMANVKFPGAKGYDDHMVIHTTIAKKEDVVPAKYFQKHLPNIT